MPHEYRGNKGEHTSRVHQTEVQVLSNDFPFRVGKLPRPKQALAPGQVGVRVGRARAVLAALSHAFVEASVPDMQELVGDLHSGHGHEMVPISTSQLLLSPASSRRIRAVSWLESIEALAPRDGQRDVAVAEWATRRVEIAVVGGGHRFTREECP